MAGEDELRREGQAQGQSSSGSRRRGGRSGRGRRGRRGRPSAPSASAQESNYQSEPKEFRPGDYEDEGRQPEDVGEQEQSTPIEENPPGPSETESVLREFSEAPVEIDQPPAETQVEPEPESESELEPEWSEVQETFSAPPEALPVQRPSAQGNRPRQPQNVQSRPERQQRHPAESGAVQRAIEDASEIIRTLEAALEDMQEVLETLELAERQKQVDEHEIESLRRALKHLQRPREGPRR